MIGHKKVNATKAITKYSKKFNGELVAVSEDKGPGQVMNEAVPMPDNFVQKPMHQLVVKDHKAFGHKHLNPHGFDKPDDYHHEEDDEDYEYDDEAAGEWEDESHLTDQDFKFVYDHAMIPHLGHVQRDSLYKSLVVSKLWLNSGQSKNLDQYGQKRNLIQLTDQNYDEMVKKYPVMLVDFHAPWCPWCQKFAPTWEAIGYLFNVAIFHHERFPAIIEGFEKGEGLPEFDPDMTFREKHEVAVAEVDCAMFPKLCNMHGVAGYPTVRIVRRGHEKLSTKLGGAGNYESYQGPRTVMHLTSFIVGVTEQVSNVGFLGATTHRHKKVNKHQALNPMPKLGEGLNTDADPNYDSKVHRKESCTIVGNVFGSRIPGVLRFALSDRKGQLSFDASKINMSHFIEHFSFGPKLEKKWHKYLLKYNQGVPERERAAALGWNYKHNFITTAPFTSYEHYARVVSTTFQFLRGTSFNAYEFSVSSNAFVHGKTVVEADPLEHERALPSVGFRYELSPLQMVIREKKMSIGELVVVICAIVGGVYTLAGILDGVLETGHHVIKKARMGKQR